MSGWLRADRIQGSVYPGFNKGQQAFLWLRFPAADSAQAWLRGMIEILAKTTLAESHREIGVGGREHPGIEGLAAGAAEPAHRALLEGLQELGL